MTSGNDDQGSPIVKGITTFLGWLAGIATLAYVAGVLVYAIRLRVHGIPVPLATASALPRELLIATSLTTVGLPALVVGGIYYLAASWNDGPKPNSMRSRIFPRDGGWRWSWDGFAWAGTIVVALTAVVPLSVRYLTRGRMETVGVTRAFYATATITTLVVLALAIVAREFILRKNDVGLFNVSKMRLLLVAVYVAAVLPGAIVIGGVLPLPQVNVCGADPKLDRSGLLIGLTSDRVYIAERLGPRSENPGKTRGKVDAISSDVVTETFIGRDARFVGCEYESSPSPSIPPLPGS